MRELKILVTGFVIALLSASTSAEDQIAAAIERLNEGRAKVDRIAAAQWLRESEDPGALQAIDVLSATCKDDDADIRNASVLALGFLCERHGRACPLALIEAMFDSTERVQTNASGLVSLFKQLPREATPILLKKAAHPNPKMRAAALVSLGRAGANDKVAVAVLRQAVHDRDVMVRTHAVAGLWHATNDLSRVVPHWLLFTEEARSAEPATNDKAARIAASGHLAGIGAATLLEENGRKRPKKLCDVLVELLSNDLPVMRRAAARQLAAMAADPAQSKQVLQTPDVAAALRDLLDDSNAQVRSTAASALNTIEKRMKEMGSGQE